MTFDFSFYKHMLVLVGLIVALTLFKIANLKPFNPEGEDFDWHKLLLGLGGNGLVLLGTALVYFLGDTFGGDVATVTFGDTTITIHAALDIFMLATIGVYGAKLLENFKEYFGIGEVNHELPLPIAPNPDEEVQDVFNYDMSVEEGDPALAGLDNFEGDGLVG